MPDVQYQYLDGLSLHTALQSAPFQKRDPSGLKQLTETLTTQAIGQDLGSSSSIGPVASLFHSLRTLGVLGFIELEMTGISAGLAAGGANAITATAALGAGFLLLTELIEAVSGESAATEFKESQRGNDKGGYWRAGDTLTNLRKGAEVDGKMNPVPGKGPSINSDKNEVQKLEKYGEPYKVGTVPPELKIHHTNGTHYQIKPATMGMTLDEFKKLLESIPLTYDP